MVGAIVFVVAHLAVALPIRVAAGGLLDALRAPEPGLRVGRHRLTLLKRLSPTTYRPSVGRVRWHGHPDDSRHAPRGVLAGLWTEEASAGA